MILRMAIPVLAVLIPIISFAGTSQSSGGEAWVDCRALGNCSIEYDHLATQITDPFLFLGYVMNSEQARWSEYRRAIQRFPEVRSCLIEEEKEKSNPNLLLMDWTETGAGSGAEVCIFLIARSLGNPELIEKWFRFQDFLVRGVSRVFSENHTPRFPNQPTSKIFATWSVQQYRQVWPSWISKLTGFDQVLSFDIQVYFSDDGLVVHASTNENTK